MTDFKNIEEKFHEYLKEMQDENTYRIDEIRITEDLLERQEAFYIPFGWMSYFLVIEDGKPAVYANACSRMDLDTIAFIYEDHYDEYDVWAGDHREMSRKFISRSNNVKGFGDLKFISDIKR